MLRRLGFTLAPVIAALALAGCSDDDYMGSPSGSTADLQAGADLSGTSTDMGTPDLSMPHTD